jgi:hypothetical protein
MLPLDEDGFLISPAIAHRGTKKKQKRRILSFQMMIPIQKMMTTRKSIFTV